MIAFIYIFINSLIRKSSPICYISLCFCNQKMFGHFGRCVITLNWGLSCTSLDDECRSWSLGPFGNILFLKCMLKPFFFFSGLYILNIYLTIYFYIPYMRPSSDVCYIFTFWESQFLVGVGRRPLASQQGLSLLSNLLTERRAKREPPCS